MEDLQLVERGRRPTNRREVLLEAAAALFESAGYESVSMAAVGRLAGVGASAIYRHFASKHELLAGVLEREVGAFAGALDASSRGGIDRALAALSEVTHRHHRAATLWRREGRFLAPETKAAIQSDLDSAMQQLVGIIASSRTNAARPEPRWVAHAVVSVLGAPPPPELRNKPREHADFVHGVLRRLVAMSDTRPVTTRAQEEDSASRRDEIRHVATALMARRGYATVTMGEIAAELGIAGPSLYHHYESKQAILDQILRHSVDLLQSLLPVRNDIETALERYASLAVRSTDLLGLLALELGAASSEERSRFVAARRELVTAWAATLPSDVDFPRGLVDISLQVIADVAVATRSAEVEEAAELTAAAGRAVLGLTVPPGREGPGRSPG